MVILVVKGTVFPDEFAFECTSATTLPDLAQQVCHVQNARHQVKLQLFSARELLDEARKKQKSGSTTADDGSGKSSNDNEAVLEAYEHVINTISARSKDTRTPVSVDEFDLYTEQLRDLTEQLYPQECRVPEGGRNAAVERLYTLHDTPEIDEDYRVIVYHCRAILDTQWKSHELQQESKAGLWFCGKLMEGTLSRYTGGNEKSRLTVKVHPKDGTTPSVEPRISYDDQRKFFQRVCQRREEYKTLEESELRDRVVAQSRGRVFLDTPAAESGAIDVNISRLRPICPKREEHEIIG